MSDSMPKFGQPVSGRARAAGLKVAVHMTRDSLRTRGVLAEMVDVVADHMERDRPREAVWAAREHLDLTGAYRLVATLATEPGS